MDPKRFKRKKDNIDADIWTEWLADGKPPVEASQELRQKRVEHANAYVPRAAHKGTSAANEKPKENPSGGVSIQINIPEFRKPEFTRSKAKLKEWWTLARPYLTRSRVIGASIVLAVIVLLFGTLAILRYQNNRHATNSPSSNKQQKASNSGKYPPTFQPTVPSAKPELATPDGVHSRFEPTKEVYTFLDTIDGKSFIVSQQHLATTKLAEETAATASKGLGAGVEQFKTGWGTAYEITNTKYNSQTIIFNVHENLLNIRASFALRNDQWTTYINSLQ